MLSYILKLTKKFNIKMRIYKILTKNNLTKKSLLIKIIFKTKIKIILNLLKI